MSNIFIIHSYNAGTKQSFGHYVVERATELGYNVIFPPFPTGQDANYKKWSEIMDEHYASGVLNADSTIIGHSIGAHFVPKYLASRNVPVKLFISVAGFLGSVDREEIKKAIADFAPNDDEIYKATSLMQSRYAIYSDNDGLASQDKLELYADRFNAEKVLIPNAGHFGTQNGVKEVPEILTIIERVYGTTETNDSNKK